MFGLEDDNYRAKAVIIIFETIFFINMIVNFLTEYVPEGEVCPIRDLKIISKRYLSTNFIRDAIPLFPIIFFVDTSKSSFYRIFYFIKVMRLATGLKVFNVGDIMS